MHVGRVGARVVREIVSLIRAEGLQWICACESLNPKLKVVYGSSGVARVEKNRRLPDN